MRLDCYENINIVDIGWAGSTQFALYDLLDKSITGYYFGTRKNMYDDADFEKKYLECNPNNGEDIVE